MQDDAPVAELWLNAGAELPAGTGPLEQHEKSCIQDKVKLAMTAEVRKASVR